MKNKIDKIIERFDGLKKVNDTWYHGGDNDAKNYVVEEVKQFIKQEIQNLVLEIEREVKKNKVFVNQTRDLAERKIIEHYTKLQRREIIETLNKYK